MRWKLIVLASVSTFSQHESLRLVHSNHIYSSNMWSSLFTVNEKSIFHISLVGLMDAIYTFGIFWSIKYQNYVNLYLIII